MVTKKRPPMEYTCTKNYRSKSKNEMNAIVSVRAKLPRFVTYTYVHIAYLFYIIFLKLI